jgi:NADPH:quinone reductase-like Zn-dependent oxidoreductase
VQQIVVTRHGGPEVLQMREAPDPAVGPNDVRINVRAVGVNFADVLARVGLYPDAPSPPVVVGYEVAGIVDAVGGAVTGRRVGDRVLALTRFGGYATSVVVPAAHALLLPPYLSEIDAAALPVNYLTAIIALYKLGNVEAGETVLLHGAGGGVGTAAIQLGHLRNAKIIGTASTGKHEALRKLGVEHVIDPIKADVTTEVRRITSGRGVDIVLDPIGGGQFRNSYQLLAPLGRLIVFGATGAIGDRRNWWRVGLTLLRMPSFRAMSLINDNHGVLGLNLGRLWTEEQKVSAMLAEILADVAAGKLKPIIAKVFPFADAADGHRFLQARSNFGKVVLAVH